VFRDAVSPIYPINDYGPLMPGLVMAAVAILRVFLAQFAVGGGILLCYFQWLAMTGPQSERSDVCAWLIQGAGAHQLCPGSAQGSRHLVYIDSDQRGDDW